MANCKSCGKELIWLGRKSVCWSGTRKYVWQCNNCYRRMTFDQKSYMKMREGQIYEKTAPYCLLKHCGCSIQPDVDTLRMIAILRKEKEQQA